jgi:hypothetical protein
VKEAVMAISVTLADDGTALVDQRGARARYDLQ